MAKKPDDRPKTDDVPKTDSTPKVAPKAKARGKFDCGDGKRGKNPWN